VDTQCFRQTCSHPYNYFLTIKSDSGASAKFVQSGQVTLVTQIGDLFAIIVKQGDYFLTYCGVTITQVKKGDIVHQGQLIGPLGELQESVYGLEIGLSNGNKPQKRVHLWFNKSFQSFL
jgi:septal ring factor EnvC (AmiA/AmiB activator)